MDRERAQASEPHERSGDHGAPASDCVGGGRGGGAPRTRTTNFDELRGREYSRLDRDRHIYVDYTGAGLHAESQVMEHARLLAGRVLGNPHSVNLTSAASTELVETTRRAVLEYFRAPPDEYTAIFTLNASGALKLVGESYPFRPGSRAVLTFDNHNSVNGLRVFAAAKGATVSYAPLTFPDLRIDRQRLDELLSQKTDEGNRKLFAFPAQSNFSGVRHPLELIAEAHARGWDVLLDAAAFVPTNILDLRVVKPDFVAVSFYKMFGYPTGVGCLLARLPALERLERPWFAGGTVNFVSVQGQHHRMARREAAFEDGTLNFLAIPAVEMGLRYLQSIGVERIHARVETLTGRLLDGLVALKHSNGRPMVRVYGPVTTEDRGGTVTMNVYDPDGHLLDYRRIEELAAKKRISLRTGCFCNPGCAEAAEGLGPDELDAAFEDHDITLPRFVQMVRDRAGKSAGAIRASLGIASNEADVDTFVGFIASFKDQARLAIGEVTFDIESCRVIRDGS